MENQPIRTKDDYKSVLREVSHLMETDPELGTFEGDRLDVLVALLEAYERLHPGQGGCRGLDCRGLSDLFEHLSRKPA